MKTDYEAIYHQIEKKHFWFKARRNYITQILAKADRNASILDIGCSSGILLGELIEMGFKPENLYGIDISEKAIANCQNAGLQNTFVMDAQHITLDRKFDIIISSDCLEHLKEDEKALRNWNDLLNPNGLAYIFVPAFSSLWSEHDVANLHFRRYERNELKNKLKNNGFNVQKAGFWNCFLFIPIYIFRALARVIKSKSDETKGNLDKLGLFNTPLLLLLNVENKLHKAFGFPFGVSSYAIAQKGSLDQN